jgi:hypothetical protein
MTRSVLTQEDEVEEGETRQETGSLATCAVGSKVRGPREEEVRVGMMDPIENADAEIAEEESEQTEREEDDRRLEEEGSIGSEEEEHEEAEEVAERGTPEGDEEDGCSTEDAAEEQESK